jgi:hypothetical protein
MDCITRDVNPPKRATAAAVNETVTQDAENTGNCEANDGKKGER